MVCSFQTMLRNWLSNLLGCWQLWSLCCSMWSCQQRMSRLTCWHSLTYWRTTLYGLASQWFGWWCRSWSTPSSSSSRRRQGGAKCAPASQRWCISSIRRRGSTCRLSRPCTTSGEQRGCLISSSERTSSTSKTTRKQRQFWTKREDAVKLNPTLRLDPSPSPR